MSRRLLALTAAENMTFPDGKRLFPGGSANELKGNDPEK